MSPERLTRNGAFLLRRNREGALVSPMMVVGVEDSGVVVSCAGAFYRNSDNGFKPVDLLTTRRLRSEPERIAADLLFLKKIEEMSKIFPEIALAILRAWWNPTA